MTRLTASDPPSAHRLLDAPLIEQLECVEARVRAQPTTASHRWALFQLMCVTGQWARAIQQLRAWAGLGPDRMPAALAYRDLIRAERWRAQVVDGQQRPGFVLTPPLWVENLIDALNLTADGRTAQADDVREAALDAAPTVVAHTPRGEAAWIADSDSRFGPVCEFITAGHYRWVPLSDLTAWRMSSPTTLVDLVWAPCALTLEDGSAICGFVPARYPGSEAGDDTLRLGRKTVWRETGRAGTIALGQKTWITARGDFGLFDLPQTRFGDDAAKGIASVSGANDRDRT
ncbi:type VI secretion system accessory protein TagJ [Burkholderia ubonensis]|uniref:type VI secretion system accessory protein TagJ n=1 Tax=Burkholderia ubonensis TaxID=101571 RepID=UPI002AAFA180|nr:type VI secretion system accessory protein TagJ [Burkholderia ubonensis]